MLGYKGIRMYGVLIGIFVLLLLSFSVSSLKNPSAAYCQSLGYECTTIETPEGEVGMCVFPDNTSANAWDFLRGREALEWSYCAKEGYKAKYVEDMEMKICGGSDECTVCVLPNGTEVEVTRLMNLYLGGGVCGNGVCSMDENYGNCPRDCPSGGEDYYCDKVKEGICDLDCFYEETPGEDPDCVVVSTTIETTTATMETPAEKCGNSICEYSRGENQLTCPEDCPSGGKDDYCDRVKDGVCDPDCKGGDDADCDLGYLLGYLPHIIILLVLTLIIYRIVKRQ
jgi:putative hemolysin